MDEQFLDRIINIEFIDKNGFVTRLDVPDFGFKQEISLKGQLTTSNLATMIELRVTNFYTDIPLSDFRRLNITAGYKGSLQATISGDIWIGYQESPGPDGVTYFQLMLGDFTKWLNKSFTKTYAKGTAIQEIMKDFASELGLNLQYVSSILILNAPWTPQPGFIKDAITDFCTLHPEFIIRMDSTDLFVFPITGNTGRKFSINFFNSPPRKEAYGWTFTAPWDPRIRPGDIIHIDPKYFKQSFVTFNQGFTPNNSNPISGQGFNASDFTLLTLEFDFDTTGSTNNMSCVVLGSGDINAN